MSREYVRVYLEVVDDAKFANLSLEGFGGWVRLLMIADAAWPASAFIPGPGVVPDHVVEDLANREVIDLLPGHRFRVHGLDAERQGRKASASRGASARWMQPHSERNANAMRLHSERNATASDTNMPSRAEQSKAEPSVARAREGLLNLEEVVATAWEQATGRSILGSGNWAASYLDDAIRRHGAAKVASAIVVAKTSFDHIPDPAAMTAAVRRLIDPLPDGRQIAEVERKVEAEKVAVAASRRNHATLLRARHNSGLHADAPDGECPACHT